MSSLVFTDFFPFFFSFPFEAPPFSCFASYLSSHQYGVWSLLGVSFPHSYKKTMDFVYWFPAVRKLVCMRNV